MKTGIYRLVDSVEILEAIKCQKEIYIKEWNKLIEAQEEEIYKIDAEIKWRRNENI